MGGEKYFYGSTLGKGKTFGKNLKREGLSIGSFCKLGIVRQEKGQEGMEKKA